MNFMCKKKGHQLYQNSLKIDREVLVLDYNDENDDEISTSPRGLGVLYKTL